MEKNSPVTLGAAVKKELEKIEKVTLRCCLLMSKTKGA